MSFKLYPPKIYLFAYSFKDRSAPNNKKNPDWLWEKCNNIIHENLEFESFKLQYHLKKEEDLRLPLEDLTTERFSSQELAGFYTIQSEKIIRSYYLYNFYPLYLKSSDKIGKVNALRIADAYALGVNIFPTSELESKELTIKELREINLNRNFQKPKARNKE